MIYGHPAPCLVTLIDGGPAVMVEPLRFIPLSELSGGSPGTAQSERAPALNYGAQSVEAAPYASTGNQHPR